MKRIILVAMIAVGALLLGGTPAMAGGCHHHRPGGFHASFYGGYRPYYGPAYYPPRPVYYYPPYPVYPAPVMGGYYGGPGVSFSFGR